MHNTSAINSTMKHKLHKTPSATKSTQQENKISTLTNTAHFVLPGNNTHTQTHTMISSFPTQAITCNFTNSNDGPLPRAPLTSYMLAMVILLTLRKKSIYSLGKWSELSSFSPLALFSAADFEGGAT